MKARIRFRLRVTRGPDIAVGPGKVDLLEAIAKTGFRSPVVEAEAGGKRGGGARLTTRGAETVRRYRRIEKLATQAGAAEMRQLLKLMRQ